MTSPGAFNHSVLDTFVQLTERRSARDLPKQLPAKKTALVTDPILSLHEENNILKSKCSKTESLGDFFEVAMWKNLRCCGEKHICKSKNKIPVF